MLVFGNLKRPGIQPADLCSDEVFARGEGMDVQVMTTSSKGVPTGGLLNEFMQEAGAAGIHQRRRARFC